jgi:hypothetical protein
LWVVAMDVEALDIVGDGDGEISVFEHPQG